MGAVVDVSDRIRERQAREAKAAGLAEAIQKDRYRRQVYNPNRMRWEFEDGTPCEGPDQREPKGRVLYLNSQTRMPFGEHEGSPLAEVPTDYLLFCRDELKHVRPSLREAIELELDNRHDAS